MAVLVKSWLRISGYWRFDHNLLANRERLCHFTNTEQECLVILHTTQPGFIICTPLRQTPDQSLGHILEKVVQLRLLKWTRRVTNDSAHTSSNIESDAAMITGRETHFGGLTYGSRYSGRKGDRSGPSKTQIIGAWFRGSSNNLTSPWPDYGCCCEEGFPQENL